MNTLSLLGETVGRTIKNARNAKNLSQEQLANFIGVDSRITISNYENNRNNPTYENTQKLSSILGIPEQFLFDNANEKINKIVEEEIAKNPAKYSSSLNSISINGIPQDLKDFVNDFLLLDEKDQEMYYYEIKAKVLRKKKANIS